MKIMWGITGAGHLLKESMDVLDKISEKHELTIFFSNAGLEVVKMYGYYNFIEKIVEKNEDNNLIFEDDQKYSYPISGKLTYNKYDLIIVSPATANTTAKIVHGVADNLVTNIVAQSGKGQIPLLIVPVDPEEGLLSTTLPPHINRQICKKCKMCKAKIICPTGAINPPEIESSKCIRCMKCEDCCMYDAIITDEKFELYIRKIDAQNTKKLEEIENITSLMHPKDILISSLL